MALNRCGGWQKVFEHFEENIFLLNQYKKCHILLLIDFDDPDTTSQAKFESRKQIFERLVPQESRDRVFLMGVNYQASESLKKVFKTPAFETIGKALIDDCPQHWNNIHLQNNLPEIDRMRQNSIFSWLFRSQI